MSKSNISEALAIGWFLAASQARNDPSFWIFTALGAICLTSAAFLAIRP